MSRVTSNFRETGIPGVNERDMKTAFQSLDLDRDGQISARDLRTYLNALGENPTEAEINEMIRMADKNMDGTVHLSEFVDLFRPINSDGYPSEVYEQTIRIMSTMRVDVRDDLESDEEMLDRFTSQLPGAIPGSNRVSREYVKEVIERWKLKGVGVVDPTDFCTLLKTRRSNTSDRVFTILSEGLEKLDIRKLVLAIGIFTAVPCDEKVDFACRLMDETSSGLLSESQVRYLLQINFVGIKADTRGRLQRIMRESDSNNMVSRKQLTVLAKLDPAILYPVSRIDSSKKR
jgi:Ca2+-binding EF-hand superfamily protein